MAIRKSELYSSLWASCDELRGGMDASQYKDYVLVLLFLKYISDKYAGQPYAPLVIPEGSSFADMVALKGKAEIGDRINTKIIAPLVAANQQLSQNDFPDFNDQAKLGSGKELMERLTNLIGIFQKPELNFSRNRADDDDILGDAYEYLMRHFASESGKSKGQFYTPAEVSRIKAHVLEIDKEATSADTTVCDPTCGSGSLLLKVASLAHTPVTLYGQEKDEATSGLARMNMILHGNPTATIWQGNTIADPKLTDGDQLKQFDFVVANPPFSDKRWSTGLEPKKYYGRFEGFGMPPNKQGDYAYLLHIVRTLKSTGRGSCILPHGVLFRGNAEAEIRKNLIQRGLIKGIIGLPANLFYGTGIPACILVIDKRDAGSREGLFLVDASKGFIKDGPKNRLRERDIHKIVDVFTRQLEVPGYSRFVPNEEIAGHDYNLNLPRYIDSSEAEDLQDIEAHLRGGIPERDIDALEAYWQVCPQLREALFRPLRPGYLELAVTPAELKATITAHPQFAGFLAGMAEHFAAWRQQAAAQLLALEAGCHPKAVIRELSEGLLTHYQGQPLIDAYAVYQLLLDQWAETMQDDVYAISAEGWRAEPYRVLETDKKKGKTKDKGWACDLVPKELLVRQLFAGDLELIEALRAQLEEASSRLAELEEEHGGEEGAFSELDKVNKAAVNARIKEIRRDPEAAEELAVLREWLELSDEEAATKKALKTAEAELDDQAYGRYDSLTEAEVRELVAQGKWLDSLEKAVAIEVERVSQSLTGRLKELGERYGEALPAISLRVEELEARVAGHLERMGFAWN